MIRRPTACYGCAMTLLYLILAAFFGGFGLGYLKFFMLSLLCEEVYTPADKKWVIQVVGALITVGPCLMYAASGPLAAARRKSQVMCSSALVTAGVLAIGTLTGWAGTPWSYVFLTGLVMGVFNPAKNAAIPLEAVYGRRTNESVNAALNIAYLGGLLGGIPSGAWFYEIHPQAGACAAMLIFAGAGAFGALCRYEEESSHLREFRPAMHDLLSDTRLLLRKYTVYLFASPVIWGLASAVSLAVTAYAEEQQLGDSVACSLMSVYAVIGVALGCAFSPKLAPWRHQAVTLAVAGMALIMFCVPLTVNLLGGNHLNFSLNTVYWSVGALTLLLGILFGIATNLIEAQYFSLIYAEKKEGAGAA